ncbi:MAG: hypothetical protein MPJ50_18155 [Pirellulales bacterium]|nr:hypothetical protein [Pirellulales bacterium]
MLRRLPFIDQFQLGILVLGLTAVLLPAALERSAQAAQLPQRQQPQMDARRQMVMLDMAATALAEGQRVQEHAAVAVALKAAQTATGHPVAGSEELVASLKVAAQLLAQRELGAESRAVQSLADHLSSSDHSSEDRRVESAAASPQVIPQRIVYQPTTAKARAVENANPASQYQRAELEQARRQLEEQRRALEEQKATIERILAERQRAAAKQLDEQRDALESERMAMRRELEEQIQAAQLRVRDQQRAMDEERRAMAQELEARLRAAQQEIKEQKRAIDKERRAMAQELENRLRAARQEVEEQQQVTENELKVMEREFKEQVRAVRRELEERQQAMIAEREAMEREMSARSELIERLVEERRSAMQENQELRQALEERQASNRRRERAANERSDRDRFDRSGAQRDRDRPNRDAGVRRRGGPKQGELRSTLEDLQRQIKELAELLEKTRRDGRARKSR